VNKGQPLVRLDDSVKVTGVGGGVGARKAIWRYVDGETFVLLLWMPKVSRVSLYLSAHTLMWTLLHRRSHATLMDVRYWAMRSSNLIFLGTHTLPLLPGPLSGCISLDPVSESAAA